MMRIRAWSRARRGLGVWAAALLMTACVGWGGASDERRADAFAPVTQLLRGHVQARRLPHAEAIIWHRGEVVYHTAMGTRDGDLANAATPLEQGSLFRVASMSKPLTTVGAMRLIEDGVIDMDDPVSDYIPAFAEMRVLQRVRPDGTTVTTPARRTLRIRHLLNHTAGIAYPFMQRPPLPGLYRDAGIPHGMAPTDEPLAEAVDRLAAMPLRFEPGSGWEYGLAMDVMGRVIEVATGEPLDAYMRRRVFEPLGMHDTYYCVPADQRHRLAAVYTTADSGRGLRPVGEELVQANAFRFGPHYATEPCVYVSGGAGIVTTAADYLRFARMIINGGELDGARVLDEATVNMMLTNQVGDLRPWITQHGDKFGYGFGLITEAGQRRYAAPAGAYGWGGIFNTFFWCDPHADMIAVLMTQTYPNPTLSLRQDFQRAVYQAMRRRGQ